jgi:hypothetical protein
VRLTGFLPLAISLPARVYARQPSWSLADLAAETRASLLTLTAGYPARGISACFVQWGDAVVEGLTWKIRRPAIGNQMPLIATWPSLWPGRPSFASAKPSPPKACGHSITAALPDGLPAS